MKTITFQEFGKVMNALVTTHISGTGSEDGNTIEAVETVCGILAMLEHCKVDEVCGIQGLTKARKKFRADSSLVTKVFKSVLAMSDVIDSEILGEDNV